MSPLTIRRSMRHLRRHAAGLLLVLALGGAIAAHHSGAAMHHTDHDGMLSTIEMCLGVVTAIGAGVVAVAFGVVTLRRWRSESTLPSARVVFVGRSQSVPARAGPADLSQFCVWRR